MLGIAYLTLVCLVVAVVIVRSKSAEEVAVTKYGPGDRSAEEGETVRAIALRQYMRHQQWLFSLVWLGAAVGLGLGAWAIWTLLQGPIGISEASIHLLPSLGSFGVGGSAWSRYKHVSSRIERLLSVESPSDNLVT